MRDALRHDWIRPPLRQRMVGDYLEVCVNCGIERLGPQSREECSGQPPGPRHRKR
jgi:hypothetical protein